MATIRLHNGFEMPAVGLGTYQLDKQDEVTSVVKAGVAAGYRHLDCAFFYKNEAQIGLALEEVFSEGTIKREDLFVVTKLWNSRHHPDDVRPSLQESLKLLRLNYVDLYLIHWPQPYKRGTELEPKDSAGNFIYDDIHYIDTWKAMEKCVDEGLVRSIGLSNFNSQQIQDVIDNSRIKPAVLQVELHPFLQQHKLVEFCQQRNVVVTAYSSFGSPAWVKPEIKFPSVLQNEQLAAIGAKHGKTVAQVVLRWLYQRRIVSIAKSMTPARLQQNIQIFDFELTPEDMAEIKKLDKNFRLNSLAYVERDGKLEPGDTHAPHFPFNIEF
jgi:diketogulonate reductase-like aldo/keto reductase